ncbi:MAG: TetR/AcrR family transcriptional regulator [Myxococcota bacterium]
MEHSGESTASVDWSELPRRQRRKLEVRARIVEAAAVLFEQQGFHATTVAEISERADVAQKTFFNHFPTKQHLVRALAHLGIDQLLTDIETVRKQERGTRERLHRFFEQLAVNAAQVGPMHRELLAEIICAVQESEDQPDQARRLRSAFASLVRDARAAGEVPEGFSEEVITESVMGAFYALMFNWVSLESYPIEERARETAAFLAHALCGSASRAGVKHGPTR